MKKYLSPILAALFVLLTLSCKKSEHTFENGRTILVYLIPGGTTTRDLSKFLEDNLLMMEKGMKTVNPNSGRLICLYNMLGKSAQLIEISSKGRTILKNYGKIIDATDPSIFHTVLTDTKKLAPASSYALIMSAHGTGWLPPSAGMTRSQPFVAPTSPHIRPQLDLNLMTRSFGEDLGNWIETADMARMLPDNGFDFILFDACYMASVEHLYELRTKTKYIIGSVTEILGAGLPYDECTDDLFMPLENIEQGLKGACDAFYNYYNSQTGVSQTGQISLINTQGIEALAQKIRTLNIDLTDAEKYEPHHFYYNARLPIFDFSDTYSKASGIDASQWSKELNDVVIYEKHTKMLFGRPADPCCGLTTYIPTTRRPITTPAYYLTEWYKATR